MNYKPNDLLNAIFSYLPDGYVVSDVTRKVVFTNKVIERITGWKANELIGKEVEKIFLLPESPTSKGNKEGVNIKSEAAILYCKNGKKIILPARQIEIKSSGNDKNKNEFTGCFTIFHVENNAGSDGHKVKEEFVSTVSHELRTPLTSIKGFADTLLRSGDKVTPENQKKYLTIIKEQADRLTRLVEDLLAVSRLESHKLQLTIRAIDLKKTIDKVCDLLGTKSANHIIIQEIEENIPQVWADADRLEQILTNLVDNAIKYSPVESKVMVNVFGDFSFSSLGISNIKSTMIDSQIPRKPRAPNLNSSAFFTIRSKASSSNSNLIPSILNKCLYCLIKAFLGSVKIERNVFLSNGFK